MNIKALPLPEWAKSKIHPKLQLHREMSLQNYTPTLPTFHRAGYYKMDGISWIELEDGRAFIIPVEDFDLAIGILEAAEWSKETKELIKACVSDKVLKTSEIVQMYYLVMLSEPESRKIKAKRLSRTKAIKKRST